MSKILTPAQQFDDPSDALAHYGVKGMKWGVRNDDSGTSKAKKAIGRDKPTSDEIRNARAKIASKRRRLEGQIDRTNLAKEGKDQRREAKKLEEMSMDFLKDPDRQTAFRMTTGEKFAVGLLAVGVPGVGTAAAAGYATQMRTNRAAVSRQQRKLSS